jgi:hypothetical protein
MGYEVNRFQGEVDEELICPICSSVLEEPLQVIYICTLIAYLSEPYCTSPKRKK